MKNVKNISSDIMLRLNERLKHLYGDEVAEQSIHRLYMMAGRYDIGRGMPPKRKLWDQTDTVLITYGDMIQDGVQPPLHTLNQFLCKRLKDIIKIVHILPFFPYSSDDGFSVIDYRQVNSELGSWDDVRTLSKNFDLMVDLVLNHVSRKSSWFNDYVSGIAPARHYFKEVIPGTDLSKVVRPRSSPLLTWTQTVNGERYVWTTFSEDQIDLNFACSDVLFEFLDLIFLYISEGARIIRLDAIAYLWKKIGTTCIHLPETHEIVKIFRDVIEMVAPDVLLLTETNVPHTENISYFGKGDEAHLIYQFSLPPLLLHALRSGNSSYLTRWAESLEDPPESCSFLNFTASHDGIGIRPLEGIIPENEIEDLANDIRSLGGHVSTKKNPDGSQSPYELNITYFDALGKESDEPQRHIDRFICSQAIMLALKGIPAIYFHSLTATPNDLIGVKEKKYPRAINRKKWNSKEINILLDEKTTATSQVFQTYQRLLRIRILHPAFHPNGAQRVLDLGNKLFAFERISPDANETIVSVSNITNKNVTMQAENVIPSLSKAKKWKGLISGQTLKGGGRKLTLKPYQTYWLAPEKPPQLM